MRAVKDDSAVPLCGGRNEKSREAEGRAFRVRRNAMKFDAIRFLRHWLCALPDELTERRPAPLLLLDGSSRYGEPSMLIPSARLEEGQRCG